MGVENRFLNDLDGSHIEAVCLGVSYNFFSNMIAGRDECGRDTLP